MPISSVLDIAKQAILNNLDAIDTTSKNIANVNTEGYKRRRVDTSTMIGLGNNNSNYKEKALRVVNRFIENELMRERQTYNKYETINSILSNTELIFGESTDENGLSYILQQFWAGWNDLANDPESQSARMVVYERGQMLVSCFNRLHQDLLDKQEEISYEINENVSQINNYLNQIYELNRKIATNCTNDLLDQRDYLLNDLSEIIDIQVRYAEDNQIVISVGGQILMAENYLSQLKTEVTYNNGFSDYTFYLDKGTTPLQINGGKIAGLIMVNNEYIPDYVNDLNTLAATLASRVNAVHRQGYNLDGRTGYNFFTSNVTGAGDIALNSEIKYDPTLIAASANRNAGDGSIALAIAGIQSERLIQNDTLDNYYSALMSKVGSQVQQASFLTSSQENVVNKLLNQRDAISGVSLEEELANLLQYEKSYQAAARLIATANELTETLLDNLR